MNFEDLSTVNASRVKRWHPDDSIPWDIGHWVLAMIGEAGEAANIAKKMIRQTTGAVNTGDPKWDTLVKALGDELADVIIYADLVAQYLNLDLAELVADKFNRTSEKHGFPERLYKGFNR